MQHIKLVSSLLLLYSPYFVWTRLHSSTPPQCITTLTANWYGCRTPDKKALKWKVETPLSFLLRGIKNPPKGPNDVVRYPWSKIFRISKTRCYFPRASESKRILKHGWDHRMSTPGGRRVLMNRILKGRHVLSH